MWQMKVCPFAFQGEISATVIQKVAYFFFCIMGATGLLYYC